ncbi:Mss4-like protein [Aspergillus ambiguus]|uniref:GFA family protein n=1 Tax=Aspergillus ambiguus TaxID=176160 RepID=UPI003CCCDB23
MSSEVQVLKASCHCRKVIFSINVPTNALPLKVHLCHCSVCRQTHGAPCSFHAPMPSGSHPEFISPSRFENLTGYAHENSKSTRFFCNNCGCHIGDRDHDHGNWYIAVSILGENQYERLWTIRSHAYTARTGDGGLSTIIAQISGREVPTWNPQDTAESYPAKSPWDDELIGQCHCGGVSFKISRPMEEFVADPENQGWLHPSDHSKWLALVDVCDDCRLVTGTHVIAWMFVPRSHITPTPPADLRIGTMKTYVSSEGVLRGFCGTCGATVFYTCAERPHVVDIATGILRATEGVMAEDWALWRTARLGYLDDGLAYDPAFTRGLEAGLREWGMRKIGKVMDFAVGSETHNSA